MPETAQTYELSFVRACRKVDISWDSLQLLCLSSCRRLLKSMSYPFSEHAEGVIFSCICNDMGIIQVINVDWNTMRVSIFRNIWTIWYLSDPSGPELEQLVWVCLRVVSAYSPRSQDPPDATGATRGHLGMPGRRELSSFRACRKVDIMLATAQKYELSCLRAYRKVDISWDGLQFPCISLCRRLLTNMY